jgi:LPXTG-motif cell wall-anchored protein
MITFDTPYTGVIKQSIGKNRIIIKLEDATIESSKVKKVNSDFLHSLTITPMKNKIQILATVSPNVRLIASKTADSYGLRLRFTKKSISNKSTKETATTSLSSLPTKKGTEISTSYYVVVGLLLLSIIILLILKKKIVTKNEKSKTSNWLFKENNANTQADKVSLKEKGQNVSIRFQKTINNSNSVVMLDFGDESYLVLMGNSNILLDKFKDNKPSSQQEFESILQERNQELEDFLGTPYKEEENFKKEPLQAYKERAASLIYSDES